MQVTCGYNCTMVLTEEGSVFRLTEQEATKVRFRDVPKTLKIVAIGATLCALFALSEDGMVHKHFLDLCWIIMHCYQQTFSSLRCTHVMKREMI